jgi:phosphoribosyl-AMP cyclohydrolase
MTLFSLQLGHARKKGGSPVSIEETTLLQPDWNKLDAVRGVLPVAVQDAQTREVLLIAYTNEEALRETLRTGELTLWSTTRGRLWRKGREESGNGFRVEEIRVNCEQNSLVYIATPLRGGICHTKNARGENRNCYYRIINPKTGELESL